MESHLIDVLVVQPNMLFLSDGSPNAAYIQTFISKLGLVYDAVTMVDWVDESLWHGRLGNVLGDGEPKPDRHQVGGERR